MEVYVMVKHRHVFWDAHLYDRKHSFVSQFGEDVITWLAPQKGETVLDVGCGTGDLTNKIHDFGVCVTGIDQSEHMIKEARKKYPHLTFRIADATELTYKNNFDAVFSNATLHWIKKPKKALTSIYNSLKKDGRFVAELGGEGNVHQITSEIINQIKSVGLPYKEEQFPWYFPSVGEYTTLMEEVGFTVTLVAYFHRPTPLHGVNGLRNWIEMFGITLFEGLDRSTIDLLITNIENNLKKEMFRGSQWIADYKRLRVIGLKS